MGGKLKKVMFSFIIFLFIILNFQVPIKAESGKKILILNSYSEELQWTRDIQEGIEKTIEVNDNLLVYYEYMDLKNNSGEAYIGILNKLYTEKYKNTKFDIIICSDNDALNFMINYGEDIFGDIPVVFCGINNFNDEMLQGKPNYTGVVEAIDVESTIDSILFFQENVKDIIIISDSMPSGKFNEELVRKSIYKYSYDINFNFYRDVDVSKILDKRNTLNKEIAILIVGQLKSENGNYVPYDEINVSLKELNIPIYVCWDFLLSNNIVGGKVIDGYSQGKIAAEMALNILNGENVQNVPIQRESPGKFVFNYNELRKYNISIEKIPSNYNIINKPFSFYNTYKIQIYIVSIIILSLIILIVILIVNIRKRIITEKELNRNYDELNVVYEELAATEESLEMQYNEVQASEERYKLAVDGANDIIWEYDFRNKEHYLSNKFEGLLGYTIYNSENLIDTFKKIILKEDLGKVLSLFEEHLNRKSSYFYVECRVVDRFNNIKWVFIRGKALIDSENNPVKISGSISDITERKKAEEKIETLAFYDQLTGLPNKHMFLDKIDDELLRGLKNEYIGVAFLIDIDNFKNINDTLGHDYGDEFLKCIAKEFIKLLDNDEFICKLDGDEFLILMLDVNGKAEAEEMANKILELFKNPFKVKEKNIFTSVSIGISIIPNDARNKSELLKNSDIAMYKAKENGKNRYLFYRESMAKDIVRKSQLIDGLRNAICKSEFELLYQPQINMNDSKVIGAEALLRWRSNSFGNVSPIEFIPLAEQSELIISIGKWVLKNACIKNKEWIDKGITPMTIAVNVSVIQLYQSNFLNTVRDILDESGLPAEYLEIEITESIVMNNIEENLKVLNDIKDLGVKIALDDFGTGYSSLSYLRLLPIDKLKLDKSFIDNIHISENDRVIVECIIKLAHEMNILVVAEGVEIKEQFDILYKMGCDRIQGYYFSKPISPDKFELIMK
ncbi:ABC transporter substrate binding protein [Clostridium tertium]|jgi:diguanylate cyclase (GGDEF)-like protein/PAS domain S-box-containing protein|uniref:ABC transporter substrate binding protein n=1 Tax=Clostridium tertium TaxID=1559 RepID=UPI000BE31864|nr:ABC transporter substrate binding protein [Clostridium tertium]MBU6134706.1 EAL domain-containing protein [Clostridium tertium]MDB1942035.1 ABC transporter substrate binding protein [Clostridium tertium]MDY4607157.1 ABC transporter substrate binding protein [Clostridium tertium]